MSLPKCHICDKWHESLQCHPNAKNSPTSVGLTNEQTRMIVRIMEAYDDYYHLNNEEADLLEELKQCIR